MAILNEKNELTEKVIHLMITDKCDRNCPDCCNKQYSISDIPTITNEELTKAKRIYLTGGEPFAYGKPEEVAGTIKFCFPNIERIVVYTNAVELYHYIKNGGTFNHIDGLTISIKNNADLLVFKHHLEQNQEILKLPYNRLYVFGVFKDLDCPESFHKVEREWQKDFVAAPNSIFRKIAHLE